MKNPKVSSYLTLLFFTFTFTYLLYLLPKAIWLGDEGMILSSATRVLQGEVMYKDFFEFWTPGSVYLGAFLLRVFGKNLLVFRLFSAVCLLLTSFFSYLVSRKLIKNYIFSLIPPILVILLFHFFTIGYSHHWPALMFLTLTIWATLNLKESKTKWLLLGTLTGLTSFFIQLEGLVGILALPSFIVLSCESFKKSGLKILKFLGGFLVFWVIPLFYFWQKQAIKSLLYATIFFPLFHYATTNFNFPSLIWWVFSIFYLVFILVGKNAIRSSKALLLLTLVGVIFHLFTLISPGPNHVALSSPFTGILFTFFYLNFFKSVFWFTHPPANSFRALFTSPSYLYKATLANLSFFTLLWFLFHLCYFSFFGFYFAYKYINTPMKSVGGLFYTNFFQAIKIQTVLKFIKENTEAGEYLYIGPYASHFYFLSEIKNPTRYSQLTPGYNLEWMFKDAVNDLEKAKCRYIILMPSENPFLFDEGNLLSQYVLTHYKILQFLPNNQLNPRRQNAPNDAIWERED